MPTPADPLAIYEAERAKYNAEKAEAQRRHDATGTMSRLGSQGMEGIRALDASIAGLFGASDRRRAQQQAIEESKLARGAMADTTMERVIGGAVESAPTTLFSFAPGMGAGKVVGHMARRWAIGKGMQPAAAEAFAALASNHAARAGMAGSMGATSMPDAYDEAKAAGLSDGGALANALGSFFTEAGMTYLMPGGTESAILAHTPATGGLGRTLMQTGKNALGHMGSEAGEESLTEGAHILRERALGMGKGQLLDNQNLERVGMAGASGALMGVGFNAPHMAQDLAQQLPGAFQASSDALSNAATRVDQTVAPVLGNLWQGAATQAQRITDPLQRAAAPLQQLNPIAPLQQMGQDLGQQSLPAALLPEFAAQAQAQAQQQAQAMQIAGALPQPGQMAVTPLAGLIQSIQAGGQRFATPETGGALPGAQPMPTADAVQQTAGRPQGGFPDAPPDADMRDLQRGLPEVQIPQANGLDGIVAQMDRFLNGEDITQPPQQPNTPQKGGPHGQEARSQAEAQALQEGLLKQHPPMPHPHAASVGLPTFPHPMAGMQATANPLAGLIQAIAHAAAAPAPQQPQAKQDPKAKDTGRDLGGNKVTSPVTSSPFPVGSTVRFTKGKRAGEVMTVAGHVDGRPVVRDANGKTYGEKTGVEPGNLERVEAAQQQDPIKTVSPPSNPKQQQAPTAVGESETGSGTPQTPAPRQDPIKQSEPKPEPAKAPMTPEERRHLAMEKFKAKVEADNAPQAAEVQQAQATKQDAQAKQEAHAEQAKAAAEKAKLALAKLHGLVTGKGITRMGMGPEAQAAFDAVAALTEAGYHTFAAAMQAVRGMMADRKMNAAFHRYMEHAWDAYAEVDPEVASPRAGGETAAQFLGPAEEDAPAEEPKDAPAERSKADALIEASREVAQEISTAMNGGAPLTWQRLLEITDKAMGPGRSHAEGGYAFAEAYEALQVGINRWVKGSNLPWEPSKALAILGHLERSIPTQTKRSAEQEAAQQFSTPPVLCWLSAYTLGIQEGERVLEPNIGTGSLAAFAAQDGAQVIGNEWDKDRAAMAEDFLGDSLERMTTEDTGKLHAIYSNRKIPAVDAVLMNPPFSNNIATGRKDLLLGGQHIDQAFALLKPGGRLVAIVGEGMSMGAPAYRDWWKAMAGKAKVRANISVDGRLYRKFGTTFGVRILVMDKPKAGEAVGTDGIITNETPLANAQDIATMLEGLRHERLGRPTHASQPGPRQPGRPTDPPGGTDGRGPKAASRPDARPDGGAGHPRNGGRGGAGPRRDAVPSDQADQATDGSAGPVAPQHDPQAGRNEDRPDAEGSQHRGVVENAEGTQHADVAEVFSVWRPSVTIPGSKPHATTLVESAAMASVQAPKVTYQPNLPRPVIDTGALSDAQLEQVIRAGAAHQDMLPDGEHRAGYMIGDGTGSGKGRTIAGVILDNMRQGRGKAVWISLNDSLFIDAARDWKDIGADKEAPLMQFGEGNLDKVNKGAVFMTYGRLSSKPSQAKADKGTNLERLIKWLGKDFDGVIAFDEAHTMGNASDTKVGMRTNSMSERARAGLDLQAALPKARILYVSATAATEVRNLQYATRLGLWGKDTAFQDGRDFVNQISGAGLAAMEVVARDMKAMGRYLARGLSLDGITYSRLEHELTPSQEAIYDKLCDAWQIVLTNIDKAVDATGGGKAQKALALSAFWGAHQRFFGRVMVSMQMPTVIAQVQEDLDNGLSPVIQLVNTDQAGMERALDQGNAKAIADKEAGKEGEGIDLESLDTSPKQSLLEYVRSSFPVQEMEEVTDEEGNVRMEPAKDSEGKPIINPEAAAIRDALLEELDRDVQVPEGALDQLVAVFGNQMAEVTGRNQRLEYQTQADGSQKRIITKRSKAKAAAEAQEFSDGKRLLLVFSDAGGTGKSYHADKRIKNQRKRRHYVVQPGWKADKAMQGLGRTNRTNQSSAPELILVATNLKAQKRFISSIARRLDQLGALTKGQRDAGSGGIFNASDNLESGLAQQAMNAFIGQIIAGKSPIQRSEFEAQSGLKLTTTDRSGAEKTAEIEIKRFLNRLMSMKLDMQNKVFDAFNAVLEATVEKARIDGRVDEGIKSIKGDSITLADEQVINTDQRTGAQTKYVRLTVKIPFTPLTWGDATSTFLKDTGMGTFYARNKRSGRVYVLHEMKNEETNKQTGQMEKKYRAVSITGMKIMRNSELAGLESIGQGTAERLWAEQVASAPKIRTEHRHLIVGALLPVWERLPSADLRVMQAKLDDGRRLLGREVTQRDAEVLTGKQEAPSAALSRAKAGDPVHLENGWTVFQVGYAGEKRLEIQGKQLEPQHKRLTTLGVIAEKDGYRARYFIPAGATEASVFERVIKAFRLSTKTTGEEMEMQEDVLGMPAPGVFNAPGNPATRVPVEPIQGPRIDNRDSLILDLGKAIGRDIRIGKRQPNALGSYYSGTSSTEIKYHGDLDTTAHEVAHALDDQYGIVASWAGPRQRSPYDAELDLFDYSTTPGMSLMQKRAEGVAEYLRAWMVNPDEAENMAPQFTAFMKSKLPAGVLAHLRTFGDGVRTFAGMSATDQTAANIRPVGDHKQEEGIIGRAKAATKTVKAGEHKTTAMDRLRTVVQDRTWDLVRAMREAANLRGKSTAGQTEKEGKQLDPSQDPELLLRLTAGHNDRASQIMEQGPVDINDTPMLPGGVDWLLGWADATNEATFNEDMRLVQALMVSQRVVDAATTMRDDMAVEDQKRSAEDFMDQQAQAGLDLSTAAGMAEHQRIQQRMDARAAQGRRDRADMEERISRLSGAGAGLESDETVAIRALRELENLPQETKDRLAEGAKRYRAWSDAVLQHLVQVGYMDADKLKQIRQKHPRYVAMHRVFEDEEVVDALKRFKGSTRRIENPFDSLLVATEVMYRKAGRNSVLLAFRNLLVGDRKMYAGDPIDFSSIGRRVDSAGDDAVAIHVPIRKTIPQGKGKPPVRKVVVEVQYWQFAPDIREAMRRWTDRTEDNLLLKVLQVPAATLRWGVTHSPSFAIRNAIRDAFQRTVISRSGSGLFDGLAGYSKADKAAYEMAGGGQAGHYMRTKANYDAELKRRIQTLTKSGNAIVLGGHAFLGAWGRAVKASELIGRMPEFRAAYAAAVKRGLSPREARLEAAYRSRELLDFAVAGTLGHEVSKYIPFTNAAVQGLKSATASAKKQPGAFLLRVGLYVLLPSLACILKAAAGGDDELEEYRQLPAWRRDFFWNIRLGGVWIAIPKPFELGVAATGFERALDSAAGNSRAFDGYGKSVWKSTMPLDAADDAIGPFRALIEAGTNWSFFTDSHIVPPWEEKLDVERREGAEKASSLGRALQTLTGWDGRKIDHVVRGTFGGTGTLAMEVGDTLTEREDRKGLGLHDSGLIGSEAGYSARDVRWVLNHAASVGLPQKMTHRLRATLKAAGAAKGEERRDLLLDAYRQAAALRDAWE